MKVVLLFGRICSGKSSYNPDSFRVVVSDLVRKIVGSADRSVLQDTMSLDQQIAAAIVKSVERLERYKRSHRATDDYIPSEIIVDGIRQPTIVSAILEAYPKAELVWLEVPVEERKRRYEARQAEKDTEPFEVADNKPIELECQKIYSIFREQLKAINN
jgi:dephospho-CoA kinase